MAINVNTVYTTVLTILNKEQRGYLTPYEFNKLGEQVQLEIFESYFENLNLMLRKPSNSTEYANRVKLLEEKIATFETQGVATVALSGIFGQTTLPNDTHRFGMLEYTDSAKLPVEVEKLTRHEFLQARRSQLTSPTRSHPICYLEGTTLNILPGIATAAANAAAGTGSQSYIIEYVKKPTPPVFAFTVNTVGGYVYNSAGSTDFEISDVDQTELILKILMYAGVIVRDSEIISQAAQAAVAQDSLEQM
tara:strand:+ start:1445 stop:2191 length:747 start_codon:yes stop_codon:yes gene_type:complete